MTRMDRTEKSLAGGLLILVASVLAAIEQNRVAPIILALVVIGVWMAVSSAVAETFWMDASTQGHGADDGEDSEDEDDD